MLNYCCYCSFLFFYSSALVCLFSGNFSLPILFRLNAWFSAHFPLYHFSYLSSTSFLLFPSMRYFRSLTIASSTFPAILSLRLPPMVDATTLTLPFLPSYSLVIIVVIEFLANWGWNLGNLFHLLLPLLINCWFYWHSLKAGGHDCSKRKVCRDAGGGRPGGGVLVYRVRRAFFVGAWLFVMVQMYYLFAFVYCVCVCVFGIHKSCICAYVVSCLL